MFSLAYPFVYHFFGLTVLVIFYLFAIITSICCSVFNGSLDASIAVGTLLLYVYPLALLMCMLLVYMQFDRHIGPDGGLHGLCRPSCADMFAYFGGTFFGRHKLCEHISPKKTVEGAVFGLLGGVAFALVLIPLQRCGNRPFPAACCSRSACCAARSGRSATCSPRSSSAGPM